MKIGMKRGEKNQEKEYYKGRVRENFIIVVNN